jgi:hypothetical protein
MTMNDAYISAVELDIMLEGGPVIDNWPIPVKDNGSDLLFFPVYHCTCNMDDGRLSLDIHRPERIIEVRCSDTFTARNMNINEVFPASFTDLYSDDVLETVGELDMSREEMEALRSRLKELYDILISDFFSANRSAAAPADIADEFNTLFDVFVSPLAPYYFHLGKDFFNWVNNNEHHRT